MTRLPTGEVDLASTCERLERRLDAVERMLALRPFVAEAPEMPGTTTLGAQRFLGLLTLVAAEFDVPVTVLTGHLRAGWMVRPRFVAQWLVRHATDYSLPRIGTLFRRDHTTIVHGVRRVEGWRRADTDFRAMTDRLLVEARAALAAGTVWRLK